MKSSDYKTTILVGNSPEEAFSAINNVMGWWQGEIEGNTEKLNDEFVYRMKDIHYSRQKLTEFVPDKKVTWLVTDSKLNFAENKSEWTGTRITFEISIQNGKTKIDFIHQGLIPAFECYNNCSNAWGLLIQKSLHSLITTGKGVNVFG